MSPFILSERQIKKWKKIAIFLIVILLQVAIGFIVYYTGGTTYVYPYFMFFPVIFGGFAYGPFTGLLLGVVGGLILGPRIPLYVEYNIPQPLQNWLIRMGFLCTAGVMVGVLRNFMQEYYHTREIYLKKEPFTGLPNRNSFFEMLQNELDRNSSYSVILVEIKNQDDIVTAFGFDFFTQLIQFLDTEMRRVLNLQQIFSVRLNLIAFGLNKNHDWYARQLVEFFKKPVVVQGIPIFCDVAFGIADFPSDAVTPTELVQKGLMALDEAKKKNKPFQILSPLEPRLLPVIQLVSQIDSAIHAGELDFHYQPILKITDQSPDSVEALVRWNHHEFGLVSPSEYVDYLESTNLVNELTYWSVELNAKRIKQMANISVPLQMAINISPTNLMQEDFVSKVEAILEDAEVDPS